MQKTGKNKSSLNMNPIEEETAQEVSYDEENEEHEEQHSYDQEIAARNSLTFSNTQNVAGIGNNFCNTGGYDQDEDDDYRNTMSVSGRETEGQSLILIKSKELIEKLRQELLDVKTENLDLQEKVMEMAHQLEVAKSSRVDIQRQLLEVDEISKTMEFMGDKVKEFQQEAERAMTEKQVMAEEFSLNLDQMNKLQQINEHLTNLNDAKDQIIDKMKGEMSSVLMLKDEIPKIIEMNSQLTEKLKERDAQIQHLAKLAKNPEDFDEIETAIKELSDALISAKGQIELLNKGNKDLNEENKKLREMEDESLQAQEALFKQQESMQELLQDLGDSLKKAQSDNGRLKERLETVLKEKQSDKNGNKLLDDQEREMLEGKIRQLDRHIQELSSRDKQNCDLIQDLKQENTTFRERYEQRLADVQSQGSQLDIQSQRVVGKNQAQEPESMIQSMREKSNKKGVKFIKTFF